MARTVSLLAAALRRGRHSRVCCATRPVRPASRQCRRPRCMPSSSAPCANRPAAVTHWTGRAMAKAMGLSLRTIQRIWAAHKLQPHRIRTFKRSNDPDFAAKLDDVVGLYMNPPRHAAVVSIDEKSQIQALRPDPAGSAPEAGEMRNPPARLQTPRHDDPVRRAQRARRQGHRPLRAAPSASGVHPLHRNRRAVRPGRQGDPRHPRQLCRP